MRQYQYPKLQIIFHKRATKYRALLRKMTYKDKGSYESSPPCTCLYMHINISICVYNICVYIWHVSTHAAGSVCVCVSVSQKYICTNIHIYMCVYIHTYMSVNIHRYSALPDCSRKACSCDSVVARRNSTHAHKHTLTHTHTHTHTHT